ncbi:MAG TPA: long-chain fatty acid--CoA ligase [Nocardioidaceae bacterium]|nr:long-chain fatty acid--CoA ligase [Nocardioidaceae bacterium]
MSETASVTDVHRFLAERAPSVGRMFLDRVEQTPDRTAYRYPEGESWAAVTWRETGARVNSLAAGLVALGIEPEQRVAIVSGTRYEWILADLAIMCAGAATTTVYPSTVPTDVAFILADSQSRLAFAEDDQQIAKIREHRSELPKLEKIVTFSGTPDGDTVITLDDLAQLGDKLLTEQPDVVGQRVAGTQPDHLATLIYTSGTTGRPKGVRLRHASWTYEGAAVAAQNILSIEDVQYLWLPMAHSFGKVLLTNQLCIGFETAVDGRVDKIIDNLAVVRPTFMGAAPRIFEKAHGRIVSMTEGEGGAKAKIFNWAFKVGLDVSRRRMAGQSVPPHLAVQHKVADKLVFTKIRERFGGRVRFFISGAAALNKEVAQWFHAAGILILEGYGLTETSAGSSVNRPDNYKFGTVGIPFDGTDFKIAEDGEILIKGPGVMQGYHHLEEQTEESLKDGWLHTGDIGEIDPDGFVRITDRKKDLFKTSGGKYVAPSLVEGQFKAICPYASQMVVHGNERNFCTAIITLDPDAIQEWASHHGMAGKSYEEIVSSQEVHDMVDGYIKELNTKLNRWETVKKFIVLEHDLSVESGEVTPSLKVKRKVVESNYKDRLDALYR